MLEKGYLQDYKSILFLYLKFFPARFLVVLNSLLFIPIIIYKISYQEMGIFKLSISFLSLICTFSSDWISKSAFRFYEKYKNKDILEKYLFNIFFMFLISYLLITLICTIFSKYINKHLDIYPILQILILLIIIPVGIRQFLFQLLRVLNKPFLYALSIGIYQIIFILIFLYTSEIIPHNLCLLVSMLIGIFFIDIIILKSIAVPKFNLKQKPDILIIKECIKYSFPTILTCFGIWVITNIFIFIFQYKNDYYNLATISSAQYFILNFIAPIISLFSFSIFPTVIKKYENNEDLTIFIGKIIKVYIILFTPLIFMFLFYSKIIYKIIFQEQYTYIYYLLPSLVIVQYILDFTKIVNFKYHLANKTYIEMLTALIGSILACFLSIILIKEYKILGAIIALLSAIFFNFMIGIIIKIKNTYKINIISMVRCIIFSSLISCCIFYILQFIKISIYLMPLIFIVFTYFINYLIIIFLYRRRIIN